jgi:hypothetical protein
MYLFSKDQQPTTNAALEIFHEGIRDVGTVVVGDTGGRTLHVLHQAVEVIARIGDADDADGGAIPQFRGIEFGDRNVEAGAQPVFQTAHDLASILDGLRSFDVKFECEEGDHAVVSG